MKFERVNAHLANERTWLAWIRTSMSILGAAFSFLTLAEKSDRSLDWVCLGLGGGFVVCVGVTFGTGYVRYRQVKVLLHRNLSDINECCALCEREYFSWNLPGIVPFKAVAEFRRKNGAPFPPTDRRLNRSRVYEAAKLCLFCTQFFDADFSDYVEYHLGSTKIADPALEVEDTTGRKNELDPKVTKSLQDYSQQGIIKQDFIRPGSAFLQEMELDALRDKRYLPKLMSNMGCELARNVRPENQQKILFVPTTKHGGLGSSIRKKKGGGARGAPSKLKSLTGNGGKHMSRRELLLESLKTNHEQIALSPKGASGGSLEFEERERLLRQSIRPMKGGKKRKGKKKKKGVGQVKVNTMANSRTLEGLLDDGGGGEGDVDFSRTAPGRVKAGGGGGGEGGGWGKRKKDKPPEVSVYKASMRKASSVYV